MSLLAAALFIVGIVLGVVLLSRTRDDLGAWGLLLTSIGGLLLALNWEKVL